MFEKDMEGVLGLGVEMGLLLGDSECFDIRRSHEDLVLSGTGLGKSRS